MPEEFHCPGCGQMVARSRWAAHLAEHPEERRVVFALFVADGEGESARLGRCSGAVEILPLMDGEERARFGIEADPCAADILLCGCTGSFCAEHTFTCTDCGRFACLRHRWSMKCPTCRSGTRAKQVRVEKYDPFSKHRSTFVRKYRRPAAAQVWDRLVRDDPESST